MGTTVLSLFDGASCTQQAFKDLGVEFDGVTNKYYASEIDPYPIKVTQNRFPATQQLHCVKSVKVDFWVDYLTMGSPCQDLSFSGYNKGLWNGERSNLFFEGIRIIAEARKINPDVKVLVENVRMRKEYQQAMTEALEGVLGVPMQPVAINSNKWTAQNRYRLYWFNWDYQGDVEDKGIVLKDILEDNCITDRDKAHCIDASYYKGGNLRSYFQKNRRQIVFSPDGCAHVGEADLKGHDIIRRVYSDAGKSPTLTTMTGGNRQPKIYIGDMKYRKLSVRECEALQGLPMDYTSGVSNTRRYAMIGNGFTVPVISHILQPAIEGSV